MDLSEPATALSSGLTVPLLRALAARSTPASVAQLRRVGGHGTEAGVRRSLDRLATSGLVRRGLIGDRAVYSLNRDHVLYPAVATLLGAGDELLRRLRVQFKSWDPAPITAALYGSAARRDGGPDSDIDLLIVRPELATVAERRAWDAQIDALRNEVERSTGNRCQITDRPLSAVRRLVAAKEPIVDSWRAEAVPLAGTPVAELLATRWRRP
jgi:predicted nucleotidyltransferase